MNHLRWRLRLPLSMHRAAVVLALVLSTLLAVLGFAPQAHAQTPTVNGLYYGDGDNERYVEYATSADGSKLYTYFDAANNDLYGAVVISHSVNDLVCSPRNDTAYMASAVPPWGGHRNCKRASDSEFAAFTLTCGTTSYTWGQALGCAGTAGPPESDWQSVETCGSSSGTWPPGLVASTSWVANINTYQMQYPYSTSWPPAALPWNLYDGSVAQASGNDKNSGWKSPFDATEPYTVTSVLGYPTFTTYAQLLAGEPADKGWEWSMVYEWALDVSNCTDNAITFNPSTSHHSPPKRSGLNDESWPDPQTEPLSDWGDLPEVTSGISYSTTAANDGPRHYITASGPRLGSELDIETDGDPQAGADGDDNAGAADEDGVVFLGPFISGGTVNIQVTVTDSDGTAYLSTFIDFDGNGVLDEVTLAALNGAPDTRTVGDLPLTNGVHTLTINVPNTAIADSLAARFRLTDESGQDGNSITGVADNGEVEDYIADNITLSVTLSYFHAARNGDRTDFAWETATETSNAGFNLYTDVGDDLILVNPELIPSTVIDSIWPVYYSYEANVAGEAFYIDLVSLTGQSDRKGPFVLGKEYGSSSRPDVAQSLDNFIYLPLLGQ